MILDVEDSQDDGETFTRIVTLDSAISSVFAIGGAATIQDIQTAFKQNQLTSRQLVLFYLNEIQRLNPILKGVIEIICVAGINRPSGFWRGDKAEEGRSYHSWEGKLGRMVGMQENPYVLSVNPCGSSSGSAISVASNMVAVSLGTETHSFIICSSSFNSVVGIKPTVGLTSQTGVIPIIPRQETIGPICRTVSDAVYVLDANDFGVVMKLRKAGAIILGKASLSEWADFRSLTARLNLAVGVQEVDEGSGTAISVALNMVAVSLGTETDGSIICPSSFIQWGYQTNLTLAEFKISLNAYLKELVASPVQSLAEVIAFNKKFFDLGMQKIKLYMELSRIDKKWIRVGSDASPEYAIGGFPAISVPAAYDSKGLPIGICFGGLKPDLLVAARPDVAIVLAIDGFPSISAPAA
ncbi:unnamed protein product [Fraxinus pennsylvanica]|uniref:Amidase domain-containing protein n=1 Tax=Fraxinus pennsylvanica TaxID=56036 RepID=A0AAD2DZV7_9LAMI|nr:unnamed protein product [Fraxinus pennsylvanica]